jgi:hypothetical protein
MARLSETVSSLYYFDDRTHNWRSRITGHFVSWEDLEPLNRTAFEMELAEDVAEKWDLTFDEAWETVQAAYEYYGYYPEWLWYPA